MAKAHHSVERAHHAAHTGGHDEEHPSGLSARTAGLTMALIGVLIAFSAAMVGSARNELTRSMIEQTQANAISTSASTKYRLVMLELEKQRVAPLPSSDSGQRQSTLHRLVMLYRDYARERDLSKDWANSYQPLIDAHFDAAESYERAQLIAEIGVVAASLAVLLSNRAAWVLSVILAVGCVGQLGYTGIRTRSTVQRTIRNVERGSEAYAEMRKLHAEENEDERTVELLDPGGKIRAGLK